MSSAFEKVQISEDCNSHVNNDMQNTPDSVCHDMQVKDKIDPQTRQNDNTVTHSQFNTVHGNDHNVLYSECDIRNKKQTSDANADVHLKYDTESEHTQKISDGLPGKRISQASNKNFKIGWKVCLFEGLSLCTCSLPISSIAKTV